MKTNDYLVLFENCIITPGKVYAILQDLQNQIVFQVPIEFCQLVLKLYQKPYSYVLEESSVKEKKSLTNLRKFIIKNHLGFFTENPHNFPSLNLDFLTHAKIINSIIDIDNKIELDFRPISHQLSNLGCMFLQIRFYNKTSLEYLYNILKYFSTSRIEFIEVYLKSNLLLNSKDIEKLFQVNMRLCRVIIYEHNSDDVETFFQGKKELIYSKQMFLNKTNVELSHQITCK